MSTHTTDSPERTHAGDAGRMRADASLLPVFMWSDCVECMRVSGGACAVCAPAFNFNPKVSATAAASLIRAARVVVGYALQAAHYCTPQPDTLPGSIDAKPTRDSNTANTHIYKQADGAMAAAATRQRPGPPASPFRAARRRRPRHDHHHHQKSIPRHSLLLLLLLLLQLPGAQGFSGPSSRMPPQFDPLPPRAQSPPRPRVLLHDWTAQGLTPYEQAWAAQHAVLDRRLTLRQQEREGRENGDGGATVVASSLASPWWRGDRLLLLQHPPTYTLGTGSTPDNLKFDPADNQGRPAALFRTERGGEATWHGPGQVWACAWFVGGGGWNVG